MLRVNFSLGKNSKLYWRIIGTLATVLLLFLCGLLYYFSNRVGMLLGLLVLLIYGGFMVWYVPALYRSSGVQVEGETLCWYTGVLVHTSVMLRMDNILTAAVYQSPLQRLLGLCTLAVRPVGAPITMRQLSKDDAHTLRRRIEEVGHE